MGTYVDRPPQEPFAFTEAPVGWVNPYGPLAMVQDKFNSTMQTAEEMLERLVGVDGNSGYLGTLNSIISQYSAPEITAAAVTIPDLGVTPSARPVPEISGLDTDFPEFDAPSPSVLAIPTVDLSSLGEVVAPDEITAAISWLETAHDTTLFTEVMTRLMADLQSGATGLDATVEAEIFSRALARQAVENDKTYTEIENYFASRGFDLPMGAMAGRLAEAAADIARTNADLNGKIMIEQAELAQKNSQFIIKASADFEAVLRDFTSKKNDRSLDYAKAVVANAISIYTENIKAYIAKAEANKLFVEVQVENLKAVVEYNKGLIGAFAAEAEAYGAVIKAKGTKNEAITEIYKAEVLGYETETKAISANQTILLESKRLELQNADMTLRAAIANAQNAIGAYNSESSLREKVAESMANIAMQTVASAYGAVNASAGLSYSGSESLGESWTHGESRGVDWKHGGSLSEDHKFEETA